ncbi:BRO-N domain-containing protein [Eubacterium sp.]|uniref:BRO-N domain-containing protein n=1 Tax=Eubacterium sp. TaxID=142586 RepID=UPI002FCC830E
MKNNLRVFENAEFGEVRSLLIDSEPWFVGRDVAEALGYAKPENAIACHVDKEDKTTTLIQGTGSNYKSKTTIINESGLYSLILSSKLPSAKQFKRWVTSEVLPSIRKTGGFAGGDYVVSASALKGVASAGCLIERTMCRQGSSPDEISVVLDALFKQSGVYLPDCFVKEIEPLPMQLCFVAVG